jgi:hypothetical protein
VKGFAAVFVHHTSPSMKYLILLLLFVCTQVVSAQVFKIGYITSTDSAQKTFMHIESAERPAIAKKIDAAISQDWGYDAKAKDPFENLEVPEEADFHFTVGANNDRVLSVTVESSYSACGLHIDRRAYHFDSKTGEAIDLRTLFGPEGDAKLKKALHKSWKAALKAAAEDPRESRAEEYKACLTNDNTSETDPSRIMIMDLGIKIWAGSCLEGTGYDFEADRSQGPHDYTLGQLLPMLTPYGFSLFADKGAAPLQTLLRGMVDGKYPISLTLLPAHPAGSVKGVIVYDRVGEPINLYGTIDANQIKFHELDATGGHLSDIEVTWDGTKLTGSFINLKSKKQMPFLAAAAK